MIRFPVPKLSVTPQLLHTLTVLIATAALPNYVEAQTIAQAKSKPKRVTTDDTNAPVNVSAEEMTGQPDRDLHLKGDVEVQRGETVVTGDRADYRTQVNEVDAYGNIKMRRYGDRYTADELHMNLDTGKGTALKPTYRLEINNGQGEAERVDFQSRTEADIFKGTYSTCEAPDPDWYLKANKLNLDKLKDTGTAYGSVVYFKGVPILGAPALSFPLSDARKSGVLPPTIGTTSRGGFEVQVPYYFNLAPNYDLTLYPKIITRRGVELGATGRYLGKTFSGQTIVEALPNDRTTNTDRWAYSSIHQQTLAPGLSFGWNLNRASDNDYPTDFATTLTTASQRLQLRDLNLSYASTFWNAAVRTTEYQVLQDPGALTNPAAFIVKPYSRLPQITLNGGQQDLKGLDWAVASDFTRFWHPDLVRGDRMFVTPQLSYPIIRPGYFFTPKVTLDATTYKLDNPAPGQPNTLNRVVPILSLDGGLVFERDARFFGNSVTQTLEPRLFYVKTPYRDQSQYPLFDTAVADFNFSQLFSENRFVGHDRIGDANQLTGAVTSRYIEPSGIERMRIAVGQRFNFTQPRVGLGTILDESRSDLLLSASGRLSQTFSIDSNLQYSEAQHRMNRDNYGVRWQPAPGKVLNLQYRRDRTNQLEQVDVSGQWPFGRRWYGVGRVNYSLRDLAISNKLAESLVGVEYKADCWVFRVVAQRTPTSTQQSNTSIFVQLELNGLSRLGSNPMQALRNNVPGYQNVNDIVTSPRSY